MNLDNFHDGEAVRSEHIPAALTRGGFLYDDGATQIFQPDGTTIYTERGRESRGQWYLDGDGRFCSFWPPSYRACYDLQWIAENNYVRGLQFADRRTGSRFNGRYI